MKLLRIRIRICNKMSRIPNTGLKFKVRFKFVECSLCCLRDSHMEKVSEELREKRGKDSLLDIHGKKLKKKKNKEDDGQPKVRPLLREMGG